MHADEEVKICGMCRMPHHLACWQENQGCTTFGCTETEPEVKADPVQTQSTLIQTQSTPMQTQSTPPPSTYSQPSRRKTVTSYLRSVRQLAKSDLMVAIPFWFFVMGIILVVIGIFYPVPSREFSFDEIKEYVGGDSYNASIEAAIRGGEIAGAQMAKAMYICGGMILAALSVFKIQSTQQFAKED